jgi:hypothetical protein
VEACLANRTAPRGGSRGGRMATSMWAPEGSPLLAFDPRFAVSSSGV